MKRLIIAESAQEDLRTITEGDYIIFYRVNKRTDSVEIVRVVHGKRDLRKALSEV